MKGTHSKYDKNCIAYFLKNWSIPYNWITAPTNFHLIIIKTSPIIKAKVLFICLAKNINVSLKPAKTQTPQKNNIFDKTKNALSKNIKMPKPYNNADIVTITNPRPIIWNKDSDLKYNI